MCALADTPPSGVGFVAGGSDGSRRRPVRHRAMLVALLALLAFEAPRASAGPSTTTTAPSTSTTTSTTTRVPPPSPPITATAPGPLSTTTPLAGPARPDTPGASEDGGSQGSSPGTAPQAQADAAITDELPPEYQD